MSISEQIRQKLIESFKTEQTEHVQKINQGLLALEKGPDASQKQELLKEIFREAHSLKGSARAVGMTTAESIGHTMEEILLQAKDGRRELTPEDFDLLYQALDSVELVLQHAEAGNTTPPAKVLILLSALEEATKKITPPANRPVESSQETISEDVSQSTESVLPEETPQETLKPAAVSQPPVNSLSGDETIRVSVSKLDTLMAQFSELLGTKIRIEQRLIEVRELQEFSVQWHKEWLGLRNHYSRLIRDGQNRDDKDMAAMIDFVSDSQDHIRALNTQSNLLYRQLSNDAMRLSLVIDELQEEIKRIRMLPLDTITTTFERMVRDLARDQKKLIRLTVIGGETELDKRVLEQIKDPIIHLLRNSVDHGIELPKERQKFGKPIEGKIILEAHQQGHNVVIRISDNGRGLNLEAIRATAVKNRLLSQGEAQNLGDNDTAMLIFNSGLSTSRIITDISGRGVGMDVVRQNVAELHGTLNVDFEPGQSTAFTITLPLTLASSRGLLVQAGEEIFALPFSTIERMLEITSDKIGHVEGQEVITYQGRAVALVWLEDLLELPVTRRDRHRLLVVIVTVAEKRLAVVVDDLTSEQEIVMKNLGKQLVKVSGIAGATVLGSGQVVLVLHAADLVKLASHVQKRTHIATSSSSQNGNGTTADSRKTILVVDDSITTRTLEKNILEAAGYGVILATNGEEAMSLLMTEDLPNLIVSDVNMPYLDGFDLTYRVKQNPRYADVPVILVTSLDSPADKAKGIEVGADAYIVKSHFDQGNLLDTIEQLV